MDYPVWETELGHGPIVAVVAVLHTFVSQFAIGAGLLLVLAERRARRRGDVALLAWVRRQTYPFVLLSLVFGAISGVGIWFAIGLVNPEGTSALIHAFVWGWAIEWVFFFVEIAAAVVYLYGWDRLSPGRHMAVGWTYFVAAWLSLAVIDAILAFMLTPGRWLETHSFWDGVLNPTYLPSLVMRTGICAVLAGGWGLLAASFERDRDLHPRVVRLTAGWTLGGLAVAAPCAVWYWSAAVRATTAGTGPSQLERIVQGAVPAAERAMALLPWFAGGAALVALVALVLPRAGRPALAVTLLALLLASLGAFEWLREGARKPWIVRDYLYANGALVGETAPVEGGLAAVSPWLRHRDPGDAVLAEAGEDLFRMACRNCHTVDGPLGIRPRIAGHEAGWIEETLAHLDRMRATMPPFRGNAAERRALARYLGGLTTFAEVTYEDGAASAAGARVFARDCAPCHGDVGAVARVFRGFDASDAAEWIDEMADTFGAKMPRFHGTEREKPALAAYLAEAGSGGEASR